MAPNSLIVPPSLEMVNTGSLSEANQLAFQPVTAHRHDGLEHFSQVILYGVAMVSIWGGIFSLAFGQGGTESNYLILGLGGLLSAGMAFVMVENRVRSHNGHLEDPQGYLLGLGCFFLAVGVMWGSRFFIGWAEGTGAITGFAGEGVGAWSFTSDTWHPNSGAAIVQASLTFLMMLGMMRLMKRYSGSTLFGWAVTVFAPIGLLWVGLGTWASWSEGVLGVELTLSVLMLCAASMYASVRSDLAFTFGVAAVTTSLLPVVYQLVVSDADAFSGYGMLVPLIFLQGYFAYDERLRRELVERISWGMVGIVGMVMITVMTSTTEVSVGGITPSDLGLDPNVVTLGVVLWFSLLLGYFPAVHKRRIPAMPIVLAATLWSMNGDAATMPWIVAMAVTVYMLGVAEATRPWVATATLVALTASLLLRDLLLREGALDASSLLDGTLEGMLPLTVLALSVIGRQRALVPRASPMVIVLLMVLSPSFNALMEETSWLGWAVALVPLVLWQMDSRSVDEAMSSLSTSVQGLVASAIVAVLALAGRLTLPVGGEEAPVLLAAVIVYGVGRVARPRQWGTGALVGAMLQPSNGEEQSRTLAGLDDPSLLVALILLADAGTGLGTTGALLVLPLLPHLLILGEALALQRIRSIDRLYGMLVLCLLTVWPFAAGLWSLGSLPTGDGTTHLLLHELGLVGIPVVVLVLRKDRMEYDDKSLDQLTLLALMFLAALDVHVGARQLGLFLVLTWMAERHRQPWVYWFAPLVWLFNPIAADQGLLLSPLDSALSDLLQQEEYRLLNLSTVGSLAIALGMLTPVQRSIAARRAGEEADDATVPTIWMLLMVLTLVPDLGWSGMAVLFLLTVRQWWFGRGDHVVWLHGALLFWGLTVLSPGAEEPTQVATTVALLVGLLATAFSLGEPALLFRYSDPVPDETAKPTHSLDHGTMEGRDNIRTVLEVTGIALLLASPGVLGGLGHLAGAALATSRLLRRPNDVTLASLPVLHGLAVLVLASKYNLPAMQVAGVVVGVEAAVLLWMGLTSEDPVSAALERTAPGVERSRDMAGMLGMGYLAISIQLMLGDVQSPVLRWGSIALVCLGVGLTGFSEGRAAWRRSIGVYGGLVSLFILMLNFNGFARSLILLLIGLVAFGFGSLYLQRRGDLTTVSVGQGAYGTAPGASAAAPSMPIHEPVPNTVVAPTAAEAQRPLLDTASALLASLPTPTGAASASASEKDKLDGFDLEQMDPEEVEAAIEQASATLPMEDESEASAAPSGDNERLSGALQAMDRPALPAAPAPTASAQEVKMDFEMDPAMQAKLTSAILQTPHEGFRPTLRITGSGEVLLEFRPV